MHVVVLCAVSALCDGLRERVFVHGMSGDDLVRAAPGLGPSKAAGRYWGGQPSCFRQAPWDPWDPAGSAPRSLYSVYSVCSVYWGLLRCLRCPPSRPGGLGRRCPTGLHVSPLDPPSRTSPTGSLCLSVRVDAPAGRKGYPTASSRMVWPRRSVSPSRCLPAVPSLGLLRLGDAHGVWGDASGAVV